MPVNRAPVLALWATVVAEALGDPPDTALTLGRYVTSSSARIKAKSIGTARAFGDRLDEVRAEMIALVATLPPDELNRVGFRLYEKFRPEVPKGVKDGRQGYSTSRPHSIRAPGLIENPLKGQTGEH
jgi:hypothetical protein